MLNTEKEEIRRSLEVLRKGGTILYPTDTIWGIGCDATNPRAVDKVYRIKKRLESKSLIVLLDRKEKLKQYTLEVPDIAIDLISNIQTPLTVIYPHARNLAKNLIGGDGSIAIRLVNADFCQKLIRIFGKPIVSTSANISGHPAPVAFKDIQEEILTGVDYVVKQGFEQVRGTKPSTIIRLKTNGEFEIIRP